jgi:hypothetical protein
MHYRHRLHRTNAIDPFEAILTELKIAGPKDARHVFVDNSASRMIRVGRSAYPPQERLHLVA